MARSFTGSPAAMAAGRRVETGRVAVDFRRTNAYGGILMTIGLGKPRSGVGEKTSLQPIDGRRKKNYSKQTVRAR